MFKTSASLLFLALTAASCTHVTNIKSNGHYWQRSSTTSALYLRGPQAQHTLNKDISDCVVELRELERLGSIRDALPADLSTPRTDRAEPGSATARFDTPNKDDINYTRYFDYADFEGCMFARGWERVEYLPYDVADTARDVYLDTIVNQESRKGSTPRSLSWSGSNSTSSDFDNLNN